MESIQAPVTPAASGNPVASAGEAANQDFSQEQQELSAEEIRELSEEEFAKYKTRLKINGKVVEKPLKEIVDNYRKGSAADERFRQAAEERKQAEGMLKQMEQERTAMRELMGIIENLKSSPKVAMQFLQETGVDLKSLVSDYITEQTRLSQMTPEEKRIMELQHKLESYEERENREQEERQKADLQKKMNVVTVNVSNELADAIEKLEGSSLDEIAKMDAQDPRRRNVYLAMDRAIGIALHQMERHNGQFESFERLYQKGRQFVDSLTQAGKRVALEELQQGKAPIPPELAKRIRAQDKETLRSPFGNRSAPAKPAPQSRASQKEMTISDFFKD
jgi:hypothetical protein